MPRLDPTTGLKICFRCRTPKPTGSFHKSSDRCDKLSSNCKDCVNKRQNRKYRDNPRAVRDKKLKENYRISLQEYERLLQEQNGRCAICDKPGAEETLGVDHCHNTGEIRGLLCSFCNRGIGMLGDNLKTLRRATEYLEEAEDRHVKKMQAIAANGFLNYTCASTS